MAIERKTWVDAEIWDPDDANAYLMNQVIVVADTESDLASISSPIEGMHVYLKNRDAIVRYNGTRWGWATKPHRLGANRGSDTAAGGVTTSYVTYATVTATSQGGLVEIDVSGLFENAVSGAIRTYDYRVQCDGATVDAAVTGRVLALVSGQTTTSFCRDLFEHTPTAGSHTWTFQALASLNTAVTLRKPVMIVNETT